MPTQQTASWLVRAAIVEQSIKRAVFSPFDRIQTLLQCVRSHKRCGTCVSSARILCINGPNLALEQRSLALKAKAFKACGFVQYAL